MDGYETGGRGWSKTAGPVPPGPPGPGLKPPLLVTENISIIPVAIWPIGHTYC